MSVHHFLDTAIEAALAAGRLQRSRFDSTFHVEMKGAKDLVTDIDLASESLLVEMIHARFPDHRILASNGLIHDEMVAVLAQGIIL